MKTHRRYRIRYAFILILPIFMACSVDLSVENLNEPDLERALANPHDAEQYLGGAFNSIWDALVSGHYFACGNSTVGDELTTTWCGPYQLSKEPRQAWDNSPSSGYSVITEQPWTRLYKALSTANDILIVIGNGMTFIDEDGKNNTERNRAFARFIQGVALGYLGLLFDRAIIVDENTDLEAEHQLSTYDRVLEVAVEKIDACIALCRSQTFDMPVNWWPDNQVNASDLESIANSFIARILAGGARTPEERDAADWQAIKTHTEAGIVEDFGIDCDGNAWYSYMHGIGSNPGWYRADYKLIGPADTSGNYARWLDSYLHNRYEFFIHTDDRRITGHDSITDGLYFTYVGPSPFRANRGIHNFSMYHHKRYLYHYENGYTGFVPFITHREMILLRAEAELRLGNPQAAADLINLMRVSNGGLPPAGIDIIGTPQDDRSPRGSLWAKLKYEKGIETCQTFRCVAFCDRRGWGTLVPGTLLHFPIPGSELEKMMMEIYTFGGGGPGSAQ